MQGTTTQGDHASIQCEKEEHKGDTREFWQCFTKCSLVLEDGDRVLLRAHPNYRNEGAWYDWCMVNYGVQATGNAEAGSRFYGYETNLGVEGCVPAKILAFLWCPLSSEWKAMVHVCCWRDKAVRDQASVLVEQWKLEYRSTRRNADAQVLRPVIEMVGLDSIVADCLVMEETSLLTEELEVHRSNVVEDYHALVHLIKDWEEWGVEFS